MSRHRPFYIALLKEPGADGLEGAISTSPAIVIHMVLHVVVVAVDPLNQAHLEKTQAHTSMCQYQFSKEEMKCDSL